jgi:hypothetical protein
MEQKATSLVFAVTCAKCHVTLLTTPRITDPEVQGMEKHLRLRHPDVRLRGEVALGEVLDHYRVTPSQQ